MLNTLTITTKRPCCGGATRLLAIDGLPREVYTRLCTPCQTVWSIDRLTISSRDGVRIDRLDWTDTKSREYARTYGSL